MTDATPLHDRLRKELEEVVESMVKKNYDREQVLAVMIDILEDKNFENMDAR